MGNHITIDIYRGEEGRPWSHGDYGNGGDGFGFVGIFILAVVLWTVMGKW